MIDWTAVEINDDHVAALRLLLEGDAAAWKRTHKETMTTDQAAAPYMQMFYAAFTVAVRRKFGSTYAIHEIVRYVAKLRTELKEHGAEDFSPRIAESVIRGGLGDPSLQGEAQARVEDVKDVERMLAAESLVLFDVLLTEKESGQGGVEEYVQEAADLARRWVREKQIAQAGEQASAG